MSVNAAGCALAPWGQRECGVAPICSPICSPNTWYLLVLVGTYWDEPAGQPYQRVPIVTNSHQHNQDSNSLGGTNSVLLKPWTRGNATWRPVRRLGLLVAMNPL